jgi:hypothetical protein
VRGVPADDRACSTQISIALTQTKQLTDVRLAQIYLRVFFGGKEEFMQ